MYELKSNGKLIIAVLKCYVIVELGVIQQYIINLKTAIFILRKMKFSRKSSGITYLGLAVALATWYNIGFITILFLAGLQSISTDILEAAVVDGATGIKKIFYIVLPSLRESFVITGIWGIVTALKVFVEPMVMTGGGPGNATRTLYMYIYNTAFKYFDMGYASAMAFVLSGLILLFSLINLMVSKGEKE